MVVLSIHPSHHPSIQVPHPGRRRWWNGRRTTTHGGGNSLSTCSCDPFSAVCFSTANLFLCGLQEFSRAKLPITSMRLNNNNVPQQFCSVQGGLSLMMNPPPMGKNQQRRLLPKITPPPPQRVHEWGCWKSSQGWSKNNWYLWYQTYRTI